MKKLRIGAIVTGALFAVGFLFGLNRKKKWIRFTGKKGQEQKQGQDLEQDLDQNPEPEQEPQKKPVRTRKK